MKKERFDSCFCTKTSTGNVVVFRHNPVTHDCETDIIVKLVHSKEDAAIIKQLIAAINKH